MKPYHYRECGLPNITLLSGFTLEGEGEEMTVSITDLDGLHRIIGLSLTTTSNPALTGAEIKFLRSELGFEPDKLAKLLGVKESDVTAWESNLFRMSHAAEVLLRMMYREKFASVASQVTAIGYLSNFKRGPATPRAQRTFLYNGRWQPA